MGKTIHRGWLGESVCRSDQRSRNSARQDPSRSRLGSAYPSLTSKRTLPLLSLIAIRDRFRPSSLCPAYGLRLPSRRPFRVNLPDSDYHSSRLHLDTVPESHDYQSILPTPIPFPLFVLPLAPPPVDASSRNQLDRLVTVTRDLARDRRVASFVEVSSSE